MLVSRHFTRRTTSRSIFVAGLFALVGLVTACSILPSSEEEGGGGKKTVTETKEVTEREDTMLDPEVATALEQFPDAEVLAARRGVPTFVRGSFGTVAETVRSDSDASVRAALTRVAPVFKLRAENLKLLGTKTDLLNTTHARYQQLKNGIPVVGGDLILHLDDHGVLYAVSGGARDGVIELPSQPKIQAAFAESIAAETLAVGTATAEPARLVYLQPSDAAMRLTWEVHTTHDADITQNELIYVDALTGAVVERRTNVQTAARSIYDAQQAVIEKISQLPGKLIRSEGAAASSDALANSNYDLLGSTNDCFKRLLGRDSFDGKGGALVSTIHARFKDPQGRVYNNNAMWLNEQRQMIYGDGDGKNYSNWAGSYDVTAHEIAHGITHAEAALVYKNESGALNEAMSDILSSICDYDRTKSFAETWMLGETVITPGKPGDAIRYMDNPTKDGASYDYYPERYLGTEDNGGVHLNSGIANLAFVLLSTGGKHPRGKTTTTVPSLGIQKATAIFYRALTEYMTSSSDFKDARATTAHAARDLYGADAEKAVNLTWDAVGVPRPPSTPKPTPSSDAGTKPAPTPTPTPTPTPKPTGSYGCCLNGKCYDCPDKAALDKCAGFDLGACINACDDYACMSVCSAKSRTATKDPSACTAR